MHYSAIGETIYIYLFIIPTIYIDMMYNIGGFFLFQPVYLQKGRKYLMNRDSYQL